MIQTVLNSVGSALVLLCAVIGNVSVILHSRVPWWRTEMGRHLMAYMFALAATFDLTSVSVITRWLGEPTDAVWFQLLRFAVFIGLPIVMGQRLWLQIKAQRRK